MTGPFISQNTSLLTTVPEFFFFTKESVYVSTPLTVFLTKACSGKLMFIPFINISFY